MQNEFQRLEKLGWSLPTVNSLGLYCPKSVDESKISFPSEGYSGAETNEGASGFWATERAKSISKMLRASGESMLWEVGAGNGNAAIPLRELGIHVVCIEPLEGGAITLAKNGFPAFHSTLEDLELPDNSINAIGAFDVVEHLENPDVLLLEIYRVLKPGGVFICSVPAYECLFSDFDISIGHYRRYSKPALISLISKSQLELVKAEFLFGFLVLPAFVLRRVPYLLGRKRAFGDLNASNNPSGYFPKSARIGIQLLILVERFFHLPFGLSIFSLAKKPIKRVELED